MLSDKQIRELCQGDSPMITPFVDYPDIPSSGAISYGLGSYGYDIRLAGEFQIFDNNVMPIGLVDPKEWNSRLTVSVSAREQFVLPPHSFVLARSVESFTIPRNIITICLGKSTYARCGLIVNVTPFEPEWNGVATLELSNTTPFPLRVYVNEGIAQLIFLEATDECERSYADKRGRYQRQTGITPPLPSNA